MYSFLATILLSCMELWKNSVGTRSSSKKKIVSGYSTYIAWDLQRTESTFDPHRIKFYFSGYCTTIVMGLRKNSIGIWPSPKKKFWLQYCYVVWENPFSTTTEFFFVTGQYTATPNFVAVYRGYNGPPYRCKPKLYIECLFHYSAVRLRKSRCSQLYTLSFRLRKGSPKKISSTIKEIWPEVDAPVEV